MKNRKVVSIFIILAILVIGSGVAGYELTFNKKNIKESSTIFIYPNFSLDSLQRVIAPLLKSEGSFNFVAKAENLSNRLKPGRYMLNSNMSNKEVVRTLAMGWETPMKLVLSGNIRGVEKLASILGERLALDSLDFIGSLKDSTIHKRYNLNSETFSSIFIPNTYEIYWTITPEKFIERMYSEYNKFWNNSRLNKAKEIGLTPTEVSILAAVVCEESNYAPELSTIAGVYINRLKRGMKLDADPTVKFAVGDPTLKRILFKHLTVESPYNTYKNLGLPPGLITIPNIKGIDAVLNYKEHNYLYFCASPTFDGTHRFASTYSMHLRNAREYQRALSTLSISK